MNTQHKPKGNTMSDPKDVPVVETDTTPIVTDEVAAKLKEFSATDDTITQVKALGASTVADLSLLTEPELVAAGLAPLNARKLLSNVKPAAPAVDTTVMNSAAFDGVLPTVQDDESWLKALKTGGVLKVDQSTVIAAVRAALAKKVGLYDVPTKLSNAMEEFADTSEEQVDTTFYALRDQMTRRSYGDIFAAIPGLNGTFVTETRKKQLLARLEQYLWPAVIGFNAQLKGWQESWMQGAANPTMMMMALMGGNAGALPPGLMQAPDTAVLRDAADAVKDSVNKVFAGTGVQIASALAYEAAEIKKSLEDPRLPAMIGVANREQMLKKLGVAVPATYPRLETNLTKYILGVMSLEDQAAGDEELKYLGALFMLGNQIDWTQLGGGRAGNYSSIGAAALRGSQL